MAAASTGSTPPPDVWLAPISAVGSLPPAVAEQWLDTVERQRFSGFKDPQAAQRFLLGRLIVKSIARRIAGVSQPQFGYTANGKPYLVGQEQVFFSITHTADVVAVAFAPFPIGVDIESAARPNKPWRRPQIFLHPHTAASVQAASNDSEQAQLFLRYWTCQEAAVKLLDTSIFNRRLRVVLNAGSDTGVCGERLVHFSSWWPCPARGTAEAFAVDSCREPALVLSLAIEHPVSQVTFRRWTLALLNP